MSFILDCSIAVTWCFEDEASPASDELFGRLADEIAVVPSLWHLEVGNVLLQAQRRGRLTAADLAQRIALLRHLPVTTDDATTEHALTEILSLAQAERLTTYDAAYLELAARRSLPLATRDRELLVAAARIGVATLTG